MKFQQLNEREEHAAKIIVHAAFEVHKELGPGLLERVYEARLAHMIRKGGLIVRRQVDIPIVFDGLKFDERLRPDLFVDDIVICEIKAVDCGNPIWEAQILSHLKMTKVRLGFLINFNVPVIKNGIRRIII